MAADQHAPPDAGVARQTLLWDGRRFTAVEVDLRRAHIQLYWKAPDGTCTGTFDRLRKQSEAAGKSLVFATNAGIFEPGFVPTGLHVENGHEWVPLNRHNGSGNFYIKPNGVFLVDDRARIVETSEYPGTTPSTRLATQSGPLLILNGQINPIFDPRSQNFRIRSGVGVADPEHVWLVISNEPVTFFQLASVFHNSLHCPNALYLDGAISKFYPPAEQTGGVQSEFAGILAVCNQK